MEQVCGLVLWEGHATLSIMHKARASHVTRQMVAMGLQAVMASSGTISIICSRRSYHLALLKTTTPIEDAVVVQAPQAALETQCRGVECAATTI